MAQRNAFFAKLKEKEAQSLQTQKLIESRMPAFLAEEAEKSQKILIQNSESKRIHDEQLASLAAEEALRLKILEERIARSKALELQKKQEDTLRCIRLQEEKTARWIARNTPKEENPLKQLEEHIIRVYNRPEIVRLSAAARSLAAQQPLEFLESAPPSYFRDLERKILVSS
jgi:hypothetical protein